jgi:hypothetical protein
MDKAPGNQLTLNNAEYNKSVRKNRYVLKELGPNPEVLQWSRITEWLPVLNELIN